MQQQQLKYGDSMVSYLEFGKGEELLIALHGFGDRAHLFQALSTGLGEKYTVLAIDLPYHGSTRWQRNYFDQDDMLGIVLTLLEKKGKERFSLFGYSLGGRLTQVLLPSLVDRVDHLYLAAPDGIRTKWMFNVTVLPKWFRLLLKRSVDDPKWLFQLNDWLYERQLISKFIHDFGYNHLKTPERRARIFNTWISITYFTNRPRKIKQLLATSSLPTDLYFGVRDEVIPLKGGQWLSKGLDNVQLHLLDEGHLLIDQELNELLKQQLA